jgi:OOP family OmpA-OmpF porin
MKQLICLATAVLAASWLAAGCGNLHTKVVHQPVWYSDAPVQRSELMVYIKPQSRQHRPLKALFFPMRLLQQSRRPELMGQQCSRIMWRIWNSKEVFHALAYDKNLYAPSHRRAAAIARQRGADLAVVGEIPYLLAGGTAGDSAVSIRVNILNARTGETLVSMEESARLDKTIDDDYILWLRRTRLPDSPIFVAVSAIAMDMALPLKSWSGGAQPDSPAGGPRFASTSREMVGDLTQQSVKPGSFEPAPLSEGLYTYAPEELAAMQEQSSMEQDLAGNKNGSPGMVRLKVEFDFDKATIRKKSYPLLDELGRALTSPKLKGKEVVIKGHADSQGTKSYNQKLSKERAEAVKNYLTENFDVKPELIQVEAYGESKPLVPNTTEKNRQINRRVEVQLAEKQEEG